MAESFAARIVRRRRPLVVLSFRDERQRIDVRAGHAIASLASDFGWDLLDLRFTRQVLPEDRNVDDTYFAGTGILYVGVDFPAGSSGTIVIMK